MNRIILVCLCAGFMILTGCKQTEGIRFVDQSIDKLIEKAQQEGKPILIYWTAGESCAPCVYMEKNILHLPEVGQYFNKNFICGSTGAGMYSPLKTASRIILSLKDFRRLSFSIHQANCSDIFTDRSKPEKNTSERQRN